MKEVTIEGKTFKLATTHAPDISLFMSMDKFVQDYGSGQSSDADMFEHLLYLVGFEQFPEKSGNWTKMND